MKRSEIKVGDILYYAELDKGYMNGTPVEVVDLGGWVWNERTGRPVRSAQARGILVKHPKKESGFEFVVQLRHLHGPYEEAKARMEAEKVKRDAEVAAMYADTAAKNARAAAVADALRTLGIKARQDMRIPQYVVLENIEQAEQLLADLQALATIRATLKG